MSCYKRIGDLAKFLIVVSLLDRGVNVDPIEIKLSDDSLNTYPSDFLTIKFLN